MPIIAPFCFSPIRNGALVNPWPAYWGSRLPYFALPDTGVTLTVGTEVIFQGDALINAPNGNPLVVEYTCDIGTQVGNNYVINPITANIGNHTFTAIFKNASYTIATESITIAVKAKELTGGLTILAVGDSTLGGGHFAGQVNTELPGINFDWIGTQLFTLDGRTQGCEGRSGYQWGEFAGTKINSNLSPFCSPSGTLNIANYFTANSITKVPDIVYFRLGINGLDDINTDVLSDSQLLIDAFLAYNADLKVIIGISNLCNNYVEGYDGWINAMHKQWDGLIAKYANGAYNSRVDVSYDGVFINRATEFYNAVHPLTAGYISLGKGFSLTVNKIIAAKFGTELVDQANWATAAYWPITFDSNWTGDGTKLHCNGTLPTGSIRKNTFWTATKKYRIVVLSENYVQGNIRAFYDAATYTKTIVSGLEMWNYTPATTSLFSQARSSCITDITKLSIREIL